jgi:hypothetical protein
MDGLLTRQPAGADYTGKVITVDAQEVRPGAGRIELALTIPEGYKVNDLAPFSMEWSGETGAVQFDPAAANRRIVAPEFPLSFPATFGEGEDEVAAELVVYYCQAEAASLCLIERVRLIAPVVVTAGGAQGLRLAHRIELPET